MKKIVFFIFLSFIFYLSASESRFPISDENKELYSKVYDEAQYVLQKNHFNNELSFEKSDVVKKYINQIDNQKLIFTQNEINSYSIKPLFSSADEVNLAFMLFNYFKERSLSLIDHQINTIQLIESEEDLISNDFVYKDRKNLERFKSYSQIKTYQQKLIKSEFISIYLKENDIEKAKKKILKRLDNRKKSLNRITNDEIFSLYINSYTIDGIQVFYTH